MIFLFACHNSTTITPHYYSITLKSSESLFVSKLYVFVTAVVISLYEEPIQPQQAASVVEKLGDYLITCGY